MEVQCKEAVHSMPHLHQKLGCECLLDYTESTKYSTPRKVLCGEDRTNELLFLELITTGQMYETTAIR